MTDLGEIRQQLVEAAGRYDGALKTLLGTWDDQTALRTGGQYLQPAADRAEVARAQLGEISESAVATRQLCVQVDRLSEEVGRQGERGRQILEQCHAAFARAETDADAAHGAAEESSARVAAALRRLDMATGGGPASLQGLLQQRVTRERQARVLRMAAVAVATEVAWQVGEGFVTGAVARWLGASGDVVLPEGAVNGFREGIEHGRTVFLAHVGDLTRTLRGTRR